MPDADLSTPPTLDVDSPSESTGSARGGLVPGQTWQGRYVIERELPASGGGPVFAGVRKEDGVPVRLRRLAASADSETRRQVWQALSEPPLPGGPVLLESVVEDEGRVEVWQPVEGPTLEERLATAKLVTEEVAELVGPLARSLAALHERDLVYLQLSAERVVLADSHLGDARLTRVEMATPVEAGGNLVSVPTDVTRVPPEALGLYRMKADEGLKAWDWWTLGRLIQELWLGHTVMAHALGRDLPRSNEAVRKHAEVMLKEENTKDPRAGGVEHMTDLPVQVKTLLRGLLTSVREARWGAKEVRAWLDGQTVPERYDLPRSTILVRFHDEQLTVAETAVRLLQPQHWREGVAWWAADTAPTGSLPEVLVKTRTALHREREWLEEVREAAKTSGFKKVPDEIAHEILSAVAWVGIAGGSTRFRWRGEEIGPDLAADVLAEEDGLERLQALLAKPVITLVKRVDANSAWLLDTWARQIEEVRVLAAKHKWVGANAATQAKLVKLALTDAADLDRRFAEARLKYRLSTDEEVQAMFGAPNPPGPMLAVLALSFESPDACGYLTHEAWREQELARLREKAEGLVDALVMVDLIQVLKRGLPVFAPMWVWATCLVLTLGVTALFWPGWTGLGTIGGLAIGLLVLRRLLRPLVREASGMETEERWSWAAAMNTAIRRGRAALGGGSLTTAARLRTALARVNQDMLKLAGDAEIELVAERGTDDRLRYAAWGSWLGLVVVMSGVSWQAVQPQWSPGWSAGEWRKEFEALAVGFGLMEPPEPEVEVVKIAWPHPTTGEGRGVTYEEREGATEAQRARAEAFIAEVQRLYLPESLGGIVAINVAVEGVGGAELMLIDVAAGKPLNGLVYEMNYLPLRGTWMKMANRDVLFLNGL
ncbi:hypothetical protein [Actomonas aquatica]|uniref:Protein kinase domain-containing protein n=1 Tax=Actomonas aquatica TaxID=2866162 RepID=A0ABZ1C768_9BACT|nr:hypothetical protein [Opitutus sp. WL0086]WRQ86160.1 hypothetical protein K1X11_015200 [Opitutus sp. WL0086]